MTADVTVPHRSPTLAGASIRDDRRRLLRTTETRMRDFLAAERTKWRRIDPRACVPVDAVSDLLAAGGKRIRPTFCISGYLAAGGLPEDESVVSAAVALELLHACALIHDDVMDDSTQRRGRPTVHTKYSAGHRDFRWKGEARRFGESVAILAGDLALVYSDKFMAEAPPSVTAVWTELRTELIIGQYMDIGSAAETSTDPELARWIAVAKSGRYTILRPLVIGAVIAGQPELVETFTEYGTALGEAFQLRDDVLDAFENGQAAGKPAGLDFEQHKMSLLMTSAMSRHPEIADYVLWDEPDSVELRGMLDRFGVRAEAEEHIDILVERSCRAINGAPLRGEWRDELVLMAHQVAYRDR
ncbi:MAG: polyprenyl synthetase family protein [Kutzneria sp.]|nr:polyprenyl synthetase family protein [Kutzneria sp.]MBV9844773.1 polyprenyl synthetase family protein [Kutzneria sp.]